MRIDIHRLWAKTQFTEAARLRLYRKVAKMIGSGLPLLRILEELEMRASENGKKPNEPMAIILYDCRSMVQNGGSFAEGLAYWAPKNEQSIIQAGEQAGRLQVTLNAVVEVVQAAKKIKSVIIGGVAYPVVVFTLIIVYIYIFGAKVIPQFTRIVDPEKWRGAARSLYLMSQFVQHWMVFLIAAFILLIFLVVSSMPRWCGNVRVVFDKFPPYSIYRLVVGSSFLMAFSALQFAGITVEKSLTRLANQATPWLRERLDGALLGVKSGLNCGEALRNAGYGFPSREVVDDLCVYSEYKGFAEALKLLADEWMDDGVESISAQMRIFNGFAIVNLAVVIGWLVTGFFGIQQEIAAITKAVH